MAVRACVFVGFVLSVICCAGDVVASTPDISGSWTGTARGTNYHEETTSGGDGTTSSFVSVTEPASGTIAATLTQTGNDLIVNMQIATVGDDGGAGETLTINLIGKAGNFVFWASGTIVNSDGNPEEVFVSGHYGTKANKIGGTCVFYRQNEITQVIYTLKKTSTTAATGTGFTVAPRADTGGDGPEAPFNVTGKATGKTYLFASTAKPAKYSATVTGTFTPETKSVSLTLNGSEQMVFACTEFTTGKALVLAGNYLSEYIVAFGRSGPSSATGTAWIIGQTRLIEAKFSVKKAP